ncbi:hypothetical protein Anas_10946 [Armadillidium nasatum]|uniref:Uncharacterized protein n=1 Tax=Armadillidium nasatum TaxID=96803 RepID=A0A5N5TJ96_9CRUS|nr:hypothetical protein Anas_10946 [Armadillidium nasatum]
MNGGRGMGLLFLIKVLPQYCPDLGYSSEDQKFVSDEKATSSLGVSYPSVRFKYLRKELLKARIYVNNFELKLKIKKMERIILMIFYRLVRINFEIIFIIIN